MAAINSEGEPLLIQEDPPSLDQAPNTLVLTQALKFGDPHQELWTARQTEIIVQAILNDTYDLKELAEKDPKVQQILTATPPQDLRRIYSETTSDLHAWQQRMESLTSDVLMEALCQEETATQLPGFISKEASTEDPLTMMALKTPKQAREALDRVAKRVIKQTQTGKGLDSVLRGLNFAHVLIRRAFESNLAGARAFNEKLLYFWWRRMINDPYISGRRGWHEYQVESKVLDQQWQGKTKAEAVSQLTLAIGEHFQTEFQQLKEIEKKYKEQINNDVEEFLKLEKTPQEREKLRPQVYFERLINYAAEHQPPVSVRDFRFLREAKDWKKYQRYENNEPLFVKVMENGHAVFVPICQNIVSINPEAKQLEKGELADLTQLQTTLTAFFNNETHKQRKSVGLGESENDFWRFLYQYTADQKVVDKLAIAMPFNPTLDSLYHFLEWEKEALYTIRLGDQTSFCQAPAGEKTLGLCAGLGHVDLLWDEEKGFAGIKEWTVTHHGTETQLLHQDIESILGKVCNPDWVVQKTKSPQTKGWFKLENQPLPFEDSHDWQILKKSLPKLMEAGDFGLWRIQTNLAPTISHACQRLNSLWQTERLAASQKEIDNFLETILQLLETDPEIKAAIKAHFQKATLREYNEFISPAMVFALASAQTNYRYQYLTKAVLDKPSAHTAVRPTETPLRTRMAAGIAEIPWPELKKRESAEAKRPEVELNDDLLYAAIRISRSSWQEAKKNLGLPPNLDVYVGDTSAIRELTRGVSTALQPRIIAYTDQVVSQTSHHPTYKASEQTGVRIKMGDTAVPSGYLYALATQEPQNANTEIPFSLKVACQSAKGEVISQQQAGAIFDSLIENISQIIFLSLPGETRQKTQFTPQEIRDFFGEQVDVEKFQKTLQSAKEKPLLQAIKAIVYDQKGVVVEKI